MAQFIQTNDEGKKKNTTVSVGGRDVTVNTPIQTTTTKTQTVSVGGRDVNVQVPVTKTNTKTSTPSTSSNVTVGGRVLSNTQKSAGVPEPIKAAVSNTFNNIADAGKKNTDYYNGMKERAFEYKRQSDKLETEKKLNNSKGLLENKVKENPDYAYNLYEFQGQDGSIISGNDYKNRVGQYQNGIENLSASVKFLEEQYKKDGDYVKYSQGMDELSRKYQDLENERTALNSLTLKYNDTATDEFEANRQRMKEIIAETGVIKKHGGSLAELDALNTEYNNLKARNDELKGLIDDIQAARDNDQYQFLLKEGTDKDIADFESYIASQDDGAIGWAGRGLAKWSANSLSGLFSLGDITLDLLGEPAANVVYSVADNLQKNGIISDEDFNKLAAVSADLKDFEYNNDNNYSQQLRNFAARMDAEMYSNPDMSVTTEMMARMVDSSLENIVRNNMLKEWGTIAMGLSTLGESYGEMKAKGYSTATALTASALKCYITILSEQLTTERYFKALGSAAGSKIDKQFFSILANNVIAAAPEEFVEEGAEYFLDYLVDSVASRIEPGIDNPEFKAGDLLRNGLVAAGSAALSGAEASVQGAFNIYNSIPQINTVAEYNEFNAELAKLRQVTDEEADIEVKAQLLSYIRAAENRKEEFRRRSSLVDAVTFANEKVTLPTDDQAALFYKEGMVPDAEKLANEQVKTDHELSEASTILRGITQSALNTKGIYMNADQYLNLSNEQRTAVSNISTIFNTVEGNNVQLIFSTDPKVIERGAKYGVDEKTGQPYILINPNSKTMISDLFNHEVIHTLRNSPVWNELQAAADKIVGDKKQAKKDILKNAGYGDSVIDEELVAYMLQGEYDTDAFLKQLARKDKTIFQKLANFVGDFVQSFKGQSAADQLASKIAKAYKEVMYEPSLTTAMANKDNVFEGAEKAHFTEDYNALSNEEWYKIYNSKNKEGVIYFKQNDGSYKIVNYQKDGTGKPRRLLGVYSVDNKEQLNIVKNTINTINLLAEDGTYARERIYYENGRALETMYADGEIRRYSYENGLYNYKSEEPGRSIQSSGGNGQEVQDRRSKTGARTDQLSKENRDIELTDGRYNTGNKTVDEMMNNIIESMSEEEFQKFLNDGEFEYATKEQVEDDPEVQDEGLWAKDPEGDYIKIDDGYISDGKVAAWKDERIDQLINAIENGEFSYFDGRNKNLYALNLSPREYRALSYIFEPLHDTVWHNDIKNDPEYYNNGEVDPERLGGEPWRQMSYMFFRANVDSGVGLKIVGQEGNHRAIILDESGYSKMPILLATDKPISGTEVLYGMDALTTTPTKNPNKKLITNNDYVEISRKNRDRLIEKFGSGEETDIRYNKDIDLNSLKGQFESKGLKLDEETQQMLDLAEERIAFDGTLTDQLRGALQEKLYDATFEEAEGYGEVTKKDINSWLRNNPLKWASLKGDNRNNLIDFQRDHPGIKFAKNGGRDWDVLATLFVEEFPGAFDPSSVNTAVDYINAVMDYRDSIEEASKAQRIETISYDDFEKEFNDILDQYIEDHKPKIPVKEMSKRQMENLDKIKEGFRNAVESWVDDYDVLRKKYDIFSDKAFKDAIADVYVSGEITDQTRQELFDSIVENDVFGEYTGEAAKQEVERFINEAIDYYVLETQYNADKRYMDSVAKNANIVNQATERMYEPDFDRSALAKEIDKMAEKQRKIGINEIYDDVQFLIDNISNKKNFASNRDLREYLDLQANGDLQTRQVAFETFEEPIRQAEAEELKIKTEGMKEIRDLQEETGIKKYSKEDNAVGWVIEGHKQDGTTYTLADLKKDFPKKWQDIMKIVDYYRKTVEKWYNDEIDESKRIYGDVQYQNEVKTGKLENQLQAAQNILAKREADLRFNPGAKTQAGYSKAKKAVELAEKKLNAQLEENKKHTNSRRQFTPHRKDYFHHTNEVNFLKNTKAFFKEVKEGLGRKNTIPTALAGKTAFTKPRSTNQSYKWQQGKTNYSTSGFASLEHRLKEHANAMAFDSTISYLRTVQSVLGELDVDKKANDFATWFNKYINALAGKSNDLDRLIRENLPSEVTATINLLNNRAKKNAVFGNFSSALVQAGNFPVGMGLAVKNGGKGALQDLAKGMMYSLMDRQAGGGMKDASTFLNSRYFDIDLKDARPSAKLDKFGNFMMTLMDKVTAENMWYMFYAQGERLGKADPVLYADEMVDRAVQGRQVSQMPLSQQSKIVQLLAPFQTEVNNQWQVMKDMAKGSVKGDNKLGNIAGLLTMLLTAAMMNAGYRKILGRDPLFDPITALIDVLGDDSIPLEEKSAKATTRVIGEILGAIPGGQYIPGLLGLKEDKAKELFGESDPSRYGTGNIGISALAKLLTAQTNEERVKALEEFLFTYGPPGYGKQMQRFYRSGQDFGYVPKFVNGEWRRDNVHYTSSGGVAFVNEPDFFDFLAGAINGQYNTKAGKKYVESGFEKLGTSSVKNVDAETIKSSKALLIRKQYEEAGIYEDIIDQINNGQMTAKQAGLTDKVIGMSNEDFNSEYNKMMNAAGESIVNNLKETYKWDDDQLKQFKAAVDIEADYKDGKKVTDSEALKTRKAMEDAGIYDDVLDYLEKNGLSYSDVGLGKRVVGYSKDKFAQIYAEKISGKTTNAQAKTNSSKSTSKTKSSKAKSSSTKVSTGGTKAKAGKGTVRSNKLAAAPEAKVDNTKVADNFLKAYSNSMGKTRTSGGASANTQVCPRCGAKVPIGYTRCPVCGQSL